MSNAEYPRPDNSIGPFKGDKIYVILDLLLFLIGIGVTVALFPQITDQALAEASKNPGPKADPEMLKNIMMISMGAMFACCLPISGFVWAGMWKGKKWAFIVMLVLTILGLLGQFRNFAGPMMGFAIFSTLMIVAKLAYIIMRMSNKVGPPLKG